MIASRVESLDGASLNGASLELPEMWWCAVIVAELDDLKPADPAPGSGGTP